MNIIETAKAPGAIGPYSQGMITGNLVYTSGQIPVDPKTGTIAGDTIETGYCVYIFCLMKPLVIYIVGKGWEFC